MRIHFHSDCPFFAGCEKMLVNLWSSADLRRKHRISFSYRQSASYTEGLHRHISPDFPLFPLSLPPQHWPETNRRGVSEKFDRAGRLLFHLATGHPAFAYDAVILNNLFRRLAPDLVHVNNGGYPGARSARAAAVAAKLAGVKRVLMVVNNLAVGYGSPSRWLDYPLDRLVVRSTDAFVTGSRAAAHRLQDVLHLNDGQIQSIHNGIRLRHTSEDPDQVRQRLGLEPEFRGVTFGVVALMEERKGHGVLIEALATLMARLPGLKEKLVFWFEGDGPLRRGLEALVRDRRLTGVVQFIGVERNVVDVMNALDVLVLPSIESEDFPNVTLEAMGLGKAVIASSLAGTPEQIVHGETGLLTEPGDVDSLADAISLLASDPDLVRRLGGSARKRFDEHFVAEKAIGKYLQLYDSLSVENP